MFKYLVFMYVEVGVCVCFSPQWEVTEVEDRSMKDGEEAEVVLET